jgi:hypothetical protein
VPEEEPVKTYVLSDHARVSLMERCIPVNIMEQVITNPGQIVDVEAGRKAYQSIVKMSGKDFLIRIIVNDQVTPLVVVTGYRTTKIENTGGWKGMSHES